MQPAVGEVNPTVMGRVVGGTVYVPEKFGLSWVGSAHVTIGAKVAVSVALVLKVQLAVPVPETAEQAPEPDQPWKLNPEFGVAVHAPIDVPGV